MTEQHTQVVRRARRGRYAVLGLTAIVTMSAATVAVTIDGAAAATVDRGSKKNDTVSITQVEPSTTGSGITTETDSARFHVVATPGRHPKNTLVVMLPGSNVAATGYTDFVEHAAELGYSAISLSYLNRGTIGAACGATNVGEQCFGNARGEIIFGAGVADPTGQAYSSDKVAVDGANSIVGRLIALIDHLGVDDPSWNHFLIKDKHSPYTAEHRGPVRLDYKKLILAGHSQGGGHAALLAMRTKVKRVVMLSSPDDTTLTGTAEWVSDHSATPLDRFYGLRHEAEGQYGQHVQQVWSELGGRGVGAGDTTAEVNVGDGSGDPHGSHRLVLPGDLGTAIDNHMSTAFDGRYLPGVPDAWTYMLTGGHRA